MRNPGLRIAKRLFVLNFRQNIYIIASAIEYNIAGKWPNERSLCQLENQQRYISITTISHSSLHAFFHHYYFICVFCVVFGGTSALEYCATVVCVHHAMNELQDTRANDHKHAPTPQQFYKRVFLIFFAHPYRKPKLKINHIYLIKLVIPATEEEC